MSTTFKQGDWIVDTRSAGGAPFVLSFKMRRTSSYRLATLADFDKLKTVAQNNLRAAIAGYEEVLNLRHQQLLWLDNQPTGKKDDAD